MANSTDRQDVPTSEPVRRRRSRFSLPKLILGVLAVVVVSCGGLATWIFGRQYFAAQELAERTELLRREGEPTDNVSLEALHHALTREGDDAKWARVIHVVGSDEFKYQSYEMPILGDAEDPPALGKPWSDHDAVAAFLDRWRDLYGDIHELGSAELEAELPIRRSIVFAGLKTEIPFSIRVRELARLLQLEHAFALRMGDADRVFACIQDARGLQRSMRGEPILISQLVGLATSNLSREMLIDAIKHDVLSDEQLIAIRDRLPAFEETAEAYTLSMRAERGSILPLFNDPALVDDEFGDVTGRIGWSLQRSCDAVFYLNQMDKLLRLPEGGIEHMISGGEEWNRGLRRYTEEGHILGKLDKLLTLLLLPAMGKVAYGFAQDAEASNLARLAIEVRLFRSREGRLPASIDELQLDPESIRSAGDRPFGFRLDESGVTVWGVDRVSDSEIIREIPDEPDWAAEQEFKQWVWTIPANSAVNAPAAAAPISNP